MEEVDNRSIGCVTPAFLNMAERKSHVTMHIKTKAGAFTNLPAAARWFPRKWDGAIQWQVKQRQPSANS